MSEFVFLAIAAVQDWSDTPLQIPYPQIYKITAPLAPLK